MLAVQFVQVLLKKIIIRIHKNFIFNISFFLFSGALWAKSDLPKFELSGSDLTVSIQGGETQTIHLSSAHVQDNEVRLKDVNFDGALDIVIDLGGGASQKTSAVYLYDKKSKSYIFSNELIDLPCLLVDAKNERVVGQCFHDDACANWSESYSFDSSNKMHLTEKRGLTAIRQLGTVTGTSKNIKPIKYFSPKRESCQRKVDVFDISADVLRTSEVADESEQTK